MSVGHPIQAAIDEVNRGVLDEELIAWMASRGYVWITRDDAAQREHATFIRRHQLSVVWVRGFDRQKKPLSVKDLHLLLTVELPRIQAELESARGPRYYLVWLAAGDKPSRRLAALEEVFSGAARPRRRRGKGR